MAYRDDPPQLGARRRGAYLPLLDRVTVATPCPVAWDTMVGDDRVRHCKTCDQQVYDVSAMSTAEVEALLAQAEAGARVCGQLRLRPDGTVMTADCAAARARTRTWATRAVAVGAAIAASGSILAIAGSGMQAVRIDRRCAAPAPPRIVDDPELLPAAPEPPAPVAEPAAPPPERSELIRGQLVMRPAKALLR